MNSDEIQSRVERLRRDIDDLLREFEMATGLVIKDVVFELTDNAGGGQTPSTGIAVTVGDTAAIGGNLQADEEPDAAPAIDYTWAKVAYDGYYKAAGGVSLATGDKLPEFSRLSTPIKNSWLKAAEMVIKKAVARLLQ